VQSILNQQQPGLKKFITASVILHIIVLIFGLFFIKAESGRMLFAPAYTTVELVAPPSGRAPVKTRPARKIAKKSSPVKGASKKSAAKKTATKKVPAKKKAASEKVILPDTEKAKKSAAEPPMAPPVKDIDTVSSAISALEKKVSEQEEDDLIARRIEEIAERREREAEEVAREVAGLREEILRGGISVDAMSSTSATPVPRSSSLNIKQLDIAFIEYYNSVGRMIRSEWVFPVGAAPGLQAIVSIKIAPDGEVLALRVERASGNTLFDQSAIKAVEKVGDFPPLPKDIKEEFLEIGVRFCPGGCKKQ